jgi:hypothetical protein
MKLRNKKDSKRKINTKATKKTIQRKKISAKKMSTKNKIFDRVKNTKIKDSVMFDIPHYPQTEDVTSSAACAMMVLKHIDSFFKMKKENEYSIWQEAVNGSVWYGSRYGLAYALAKRGAQVGIVTNIKDEGYDKKLAVYENVNLDALSASFNEIKNKTKEMEISEEFTHIISLNTIKKSLSSKKIPIVLIDAKVINPYLESLPHWVVVKGYDKDNFYINDPYSDSTVTIDTEIFKSALGYDNNYNMVLINAKSKKQ